MKKLLLMVLIVVLAYANGVEKSEKRGISKDFQTMGHRKSSDNKFTKIVNEHRSEDCSKISSRDKTEIRERIFDKKTKKMNQNFLAKTNSTVFPLTIELEYLYDESGKYTYTYDNDGNMTVELYEEFYAGELSWAEKYLYTYDDNGYLITEIYQDMEEGNWVNSERYTLTYDAMGRIQSELYEEFYNDNWEQQYYAIYTWENGNIIELLEQEWDGSSWIDIFKISASYDNDDNMLQILFSTYEDDAWLVEEIMSWTYDENGNELTALMQSSDETGTLQNSMREYMSYDSNNNLVDYVIEFWEGDAWVAYMRVLLTYSENGDILTESEQIYDEESGEWLTMDTITYEYSYDAGGNLTELVESSVYEESTYYGKQVYNFDVNNNCVQGEYYESWDGDSWEDSEEYLMLYYNNGADVIDEYAHKISVIYSGSTAINDDVKVPEKIVLNQNYPNPFNPATTISFSLPAKLDVKLTVYNGLGQKVDEIVNSNLNAGVYTYSFDGTGMNSGIYFYKLQTDNHHIVKKMILIK